MKTNIDLLRTHLTNANNLKTLIEKFNNKIKESSIDKYGLKFNYDNRFSVFDVRANLCCYYGYYGDSSCSTFTRIDDKLAQKYFDYAINKHKDLILQTMGEAAEIEASKLEEAAKAELEQSIKLIASLEEFKNNE